MPVNGPDGLTPRQRAFIAAYLDARRPNATHAATVAGYSFPGKQGSRLLTYPAIRAIVQPEIDRRAAERRAEWERSRALPRPRRRGWKLPGRPRRT